MVCEANTKKNAPVYKSWVLLCVLVAKGMEYEGGFSAATWKTNLTKSITALKGAASEVQTSDNPTLTFVRLASSGPSLSPV